MAFKRPAVRTRLSPPKRTGPIRVPFFLAETSGSRTVLRYNAKRFASSRKNAPRFCVNLAVETESLSPPTVWSHLRSTLSPLSFVTATRANLFLSRTVLRYNAKRFASSRKNALRFCVNLAVETESLSPPTVWSHLCHHFPAFKFCDRDPAAPSEACVQVPSVVSLRS